MTADPAGAVGFYRKALGWQLENMDTAIAPTAAQADLLIDSKERLEEI